MKKQGGKFLSNKTILLGLSGSIALYRSCDLVRELKSQGANVICIMTKCAQNFVTAVTFQALSGNPVYTDPFSNEEDWAVLHTTLADKADLILICPASANIIARLAAGMADDMVTSVVLASKAKVLIAPAMNDNMFANKITQDNIQKLKKAGYQFIEPTEGDLVCGRVGMGHIAEQETILQQVSSILAK